MHHLFPLQQLVFLLSSPFILLVISTALDRTITTASISVTSLIDQPTSLTEASPPTQTVFHESVNHPEPEVIYAPSTIYPIPGVNPLLHFIGILILVISVLGFISTFSILPFSLHAMSSSQKPSSSSSSRDPSKSSSSSASKPSSSSSSSSSKPSSSSSSSSSSKPPTPTPYISPNAWMSFFLFCCLVLIILQGPLGLTGNGVPALPFGGGAGFGGVGVGIPNLAMGGLPGCVGFIANAVPWCQQQGTTINVQTAPAPPVQVVQQQQPVLIPQNTWYANAQPQQRKLSILIAFSSYPQIEFYQAQPYRQRRSFQYQRPGLQLQVDSSRPSQGRSTICQQYPYLCQPLIPMAYAQQVQAQPEPQPILVDTSPAHIMPGKSRCAELC